MGDKRRIILLDFSFHSTSPTSNHCTPSALHYQTVLQSELQHGITSFSFTYYTVTLSVLPRRKGKEKPKKTPPLTKKIKNGTYVLWSGSWEFYRSAIDR